MSDSNVTIKLDSRVFYGLVALVAVVGIFGIGWWLGQQLTGGEAQTATTAPASNVGGAAVNNTGAGGGAANPIQVQPGQSTTLNQTDAVNPAQAQAGQQAASKPVAPEDVPVEEGQPRIWVDEVADTNFVYDFGEIPGDQATEKDFVVKNVGEGVLVIESASASCGCTAALVADSELDPGEETTVRVSYDPRVNSEQGKFVTKQVRIKSNDPLAPLVEFTLQADVAAQ